MVLPNDSHEVVLKIVLEGGAAALAVAQARPAAAAHAGSGFSEGAFARFASRSFAPIGPAEAAGDEGDVERFFYRWGGLLASILTDLRRRYGGDLDQFLIHMIFMLGELDSLNLARKAQASGAPAAVLRACELNAQSLSDISGVPRESVRRKLAGLEAAGLIRRTETGRYAAAGDSDARAFFERLGPLFWAGTQAPPRSARSVHP
jgi:hypothetical protein